MEDCKMTDDSLPSPTLPYQGCEDPPQVVPLHGPPYVPSEQTHPGPKHHVDPWVVVKNSSKHTHVVQRGGQVRVPEPDEVRTSVAPAQHPGSYSLSLAYVARQVVHFDLCVFLSRVRLVVVVVGGNGETFRMERVCFFFVEDCFSAKKAKSKSTRT